jgi:hypothetical protein
VGPCPGGPLLVRPAPPKNEREPWSSWPPPAPSAPGVFP